METLFRRSGLALTLDRKSNPQYYLDRTIKRACAALTETYQPTRKPADSPESKVVKGFLSKRPKKEYKSAAPPPEPQESTHCGIELDEPEKPTLSEARKILTMLSKSAPEKLSKDPVKYWLDPEIPKNKLGVISGEPSSGKSLWLLYQCVELAKAGANIIYFDGEMATDDVQKRIDGFGGELPPTLWYWGRFTPDLELPEIDSPLLPLLIKEVPGVVLIFDTMSAFFHGDENSNSDVNWFFRTLRKLQAMGSTVIVLHHTTKDPKVSRPVAQALSRELLILGD
jgi:AAA domain